MSLKCVLQNDVSIVLAGEAGQGIQTIEQLLTRIVKRAGLNVFATKEYMSRVRGGINSTEIRVASYPVAAFVDRIDLCVVLDPKALEHLRHRLTEHTLIIGDPEFLGAQKETIGVPFLKMAQELGSKLFSNTIAVGFIAGLLGIEEEIASEVSKQSFSQKGDDVIEKNCQAVKQGWDLARETCAKQEIKIELKRDPAVAKQIFISANQAVALGAAAGGCNFLASYPMSPSTGVLTFLAQHAAEFEIVVEQAEDEIAAINMGLGSWYAGGRAMVTTSGGGLALMIEGLSLAGCIESPMVIHLAQRPGPATGLPTRTEQGDLDLVLHAGHGEFPRVIFAPGTVQDAFFCTSRAFYLADKYQIPVFVLTDQFLLDSYYNIKSFPPLPRDTENFFVKTALDYKRYRLTENGISPRGIPGFGEGLVCADSDEHGEEGFITEDFRVRTAMVDKRLNKQNAFSPESLAPELYGEENYKKLVVCWGSTFHAAKEAVERQGQKETALLYFKQVWPLPKQTSDYLNKAQEVICVENNATGQFAKIIRRETGFLAHRNLLKYNGLPFTTEELITKI